METVEESLVKLQKYGKLLMITRMITEDYNLYFSYSFGCFIY